MSLLPPGYYEITLNESTPPSQYRLSPDETTPPAYLHVDDGEVTIRYPSGQTHSGYAAILLLKTDLLPVASVEEVDPEETPFTDE